MPDAEGAPKGFQYKKCPKCGGRSMRDDQPCAQCRNNPPCSRCKRPTGSKLDPPLCRQCQKDDARAVSQASRTCPQCGKWKKPEYPLCWECNKPTWIASGESTSNKPWITEQWKERRAQIVARTEKCERCQSPFDSKHPAVVNHLKTSYEQADGKTDWNAYVAMRDDEVEVICKSCHWAFTRFGVYPGDPKITCPSCGKSKQPHYAACFECYKKSPEFAKKQEHRRAMEELDERESANQAALLESSDCPHDCERVEYAELEDGKDSGQVNELARCAAEKLVRKYPQWFRIVTKP